jgi:hypothetical protein
MDTGARQSLNFFLHLASVEVSLILQFLDNVSKLDAAITCKRLLADAMQPFSWKHASMLCITDAQLLQQQQQNRAHPPYSLLQLAPVHLLIKSPHIQPASLSPGCILHLYKIEQHDYHASDLSPLLTQPTVIQELRQLQLGYSGYLNCSGKSSGQCSFACIAAASELTSLSVSCGGQSSQQSKFFSQLKNSLTQVLARPQLIELIMRGLYNANVDLLQPLLQSPGHLRRLHLYGDLNMAPVADAAGMQFFTSLGQALPHLQVLSLGDFSIQRISTDVVSRFFASLQEVHTLQLCYCPDVDKLLPLVTIIPSLKNLLIFGWVDAMDNTRSSPSLEALTTLQAAMPQLYITTGRWTGIGTADCNDDHLNVNMDKLLFVKCSELL